MTDDVTDKLATQQQTDFDASGNHAPMFKVPGILKRFKPPIIHPRRDELITSWKPTCANCGERMDEFEEGTKREPKSGLLYSGWFSEHCGSYFFLCES